MLETILIESIRFIDDVNLANIFEFESIKEGKTKIINLGILNLNFPSFLNWTVSLSNPNTNPIPPRHRRFINGIKV